MYSSVTFNEGLLPKKLFLVYYPQARTAVLAIGFSLSFGAMFSKTWRVHKIFTAAKTLKKMVRCNKTNNLYVMHKTQDSVRSRINITEQHFI